MKEMAQHFWSRVDMSGGPDACWPWTKLISVHGYGAVSFCGVKLVAHRIAYEFSKGPIPDGLVVDHLCRNRRCQNPSHLDAVTSAQNTMRGESPKIVAYKSGKCMRGHSLDGAVIYKKGRCCKECQRIRESWRKARRQAARALRDAHWRDLAEAEASLHPQVWD